MRLIWMVAWLVFSCALAAESGKPWVVYYSDQEGAQAFDPYDLVVLDSRYHPPLSTLGKKHLLGYISLGEVEEHRSHFARAAHLTLNENPNWPGSFYVDVRNSDWPKLVIEELIPAILVQGFNGIFLDTLDNPPELERTDPKKYKGMTEASARLVRGIRHHYPNITIMMNRGYELLDSVGGSIDMVLGESVFADYDFEDKSYGLVETPLYEQQVRLLKAAQAKFPKLQVFTLDYWNPADRAGIQRIYTEQRKNGFRPYVSTIELNQIVSEPTHDD